MARRKSLVKLPFFKIKINRKTLIHATGVFLLACALIGGFSFLEIIFPKFFGGKYLEKIRVMLSSRFGGLSVFVPLLLLLFSAHFFNSKRLKLVKWGTTIGLVLIFVSLIGLFQAGSIGKIMFENLKLDFSLAGGIILLLLLFLLGLILALDTSFDACLLFIFDGVKYVWKTVSHILESGDKKEEVAKLGKSEPEFIHDSTQKGEQKPVPIAPPKVQPIITKKETNSESQSDELFMKQHIPQIQSSTWVYPPVSLLSEIAQQEADRGDVKENASIIERTLDSFGIQARVAEVNRGPAVTQYAISIARGTRLSKITALGNDLALALAATTGQVRVEAPIPGRSYVGIEIPNKRPELVTLKRMFEAKEFTSSTDPLLVPLGLDVSGKPATASISRMPHALIAGTTGSGKSVLLNAWISTFLFRTKPTELQMIMVDPKRVELTLYNAIPHLLTEVIVDVETVIKALRWTVSEMENRLREFARVGVRNLDGYNDLATVQRKPYIVFIIDELADLMIFAPRDAEELITRIAQMSRATGIHLVLATQRPSVDVITGLMKANIPTRIAFNVSSMIDSRVIIDMPGAEKLLGKGDMLYLPPDQAKPRRIQGPFITEKEVGQIVNFLRSQVPEVHYTEEVTAETAGSNTVGGMASYGNDSEKDPLFSQAVNVISSFGKASASLLQRKLAIGYSRAARLVDQLEKEGYVGQQDGSKPREVIKRQSTMPSSLSHDTTQENEGE